MPRPRHRPDYAVRGEADGRLLPPGTGEAGEILEKFRNDGIKTAAVVAPETAERGKFRKMGLEENRGKDFHVFAEREEAEGWFIGD